MNQSFSVEEASDSTVFIYVTHEIDAGIFNRTGCHERNRVIVSKMRWTGSVSVVATGAGILLSPFFPEPRAARADGFLM